MKNGGRKCIRDGILKRRVGLALSDTLSTPQVGRKTARKLNQKREKNWYEMGIIFVPT